MKHINVGATKKTPRTHQNRSFSVFIHLLCQTNNRRSKMEKTKTKNAEGGWANENLLRVHSSKSQLQCVCPPSLPNKEHKKRNGKKQKEKTQKTVGQMKRCRVKNCIFRCNKNAEDGEGNENLRRRHQKPPLVFHSIEQQHQHIVFHVFFLTGEKRNTKPSNRNAKWQCNNKCLGIRKIKKNVKKEDRQKRYVFMGTVA